MVLRAAAVGEPPMEGGIFEFVGMCFLDLDAARQQPPLIEKIYFLLQQISSLSSSFFFLFFFF